jgi:predicted metal-binding membrane protein
MLEAALRHERVILAAGLLGLAALAWVEVARMAGGASMAAMSMPGMSPAQEVGLGWLVLMWAVMMVAMMTPSAAPVVLLFAGVTRRRRAGGVPAASALVFVSGYLLVWTVYATLAATGQWLLHRAALLSPTMATTSPLLAGSLLVAAGVYQWLPLKATCLHHCRSPLAVFSSEWREGRWGALRMGMRHGSFCVGCCWLVMTLLFVAGVMNLLWVAALAGFVLLEKLVPGGDRVGRISGLGLVAWGGWLLAHGPGLH